MKRQVRIGIVVGAVAWPILLILASLARADDPPKPVVPVVNAVMPQVQPLVIIADGSITKSSLSWQVIEPPATVLRVEGSIALILNPTPGTTYQLAVVAFGDTPPFAFRFINATAPTTPLPTPSPVVVTPPAPPAPVGPVVTPVASTDQFGLVASTLSTMGSLTWTPAQTAFRRGLLAQTFAAQGIAVPTAPNLQAAVFQSGAAIVGAVGTDAWLGWKTNLIGPIQAELGSLVKRGKITTPAQFGQALTDISTALEEN